MTLAVGGTFNPSQPTNHQFVYYILTSIANTSCNFLLKKCENPLLCKGFSKAKDSHIFSTKNNSVFVILPFEIFDISLTNGILNNNFEQLAPDLYLGGLKALFGNI